MAAGEARGGEGHGVEHSLVPGRSNYTNQVRPDSGPRSRDEAWQGAHGGSPTSGGARGLPAWRVENGDPGPRAWWPGGAEEATQLASATGSDEKSARGRRGKKRPTAE